MGRVPYPSEPLMVHSGLADTVITTVPYSLINSGAVEEFEPVDVFVPILQQLSKKFKNKLFPH
jgi:hypothetical protein